MREICKSISFGQMRAVVSLGAVGPMNGIAFNCGCAAVTPVRGSPILPARDSVDIYVPNFNGISVSGIFVIFRARWQLAAILPTFREPEGLP